MNKEELEKYKIRDYYMIPVEVVDNVFYLFEQQCKKQKEINQKAIEYVEEHRIKNPYHYEFNCFMGNARASDLLQILEEKGD